MIGCLLGRVRIRRNCLVDHRGLSRRPEYFQRRHLFTGFRWENRFRVLQHEHFINPVLYIEYEHINGADKILKEIEGHDVEADNGDPNAEARQDHEQELEFKLILSKNFKGWNIAQNTIAPRICPTQPWEFGYAIGASRPLALKASSKRCSFCAENFVAGVEMYGGLGDRYSFGLQRYFPIPGAGGRLEPALQLDLAPLSRLRPQRQQSSIPATLGSFARIFRLRRGTWPVCSEATNDRQQVEQDKLKRGGADNFKRNHENSPTSPSPHFLSAPLLCLRPIICGCLRADELRATKQEQLRLC